MIQHRPAGIVVTTGVLLFFSAADSPAKLMFRTDDVYVRHADLIVVGDTVSAGTHVGVSVAAVEVRSVLMGALPDSTVYVRDFPGGEEDMPRFRIGERSLLFLPKPRGLRCVLVCGSASDQARVSA